MPMRPRIIPSPAAPFHASPASAAPATRRGFLSRTLAAAGGALLAASGARIPAASAETAPGPGTTGTDPYLGEIMLVAWNFAPVGWAFCNGQLLAIAQNQALFSLLGTQYGGNGTTTFALPDLRGRVPMHFGQGPGLSNHVIGEMSGFESVTLLATQMPAHTHPAIADANLGTSSSPAGTLPAREPSGTPIYGAGTGAVMASSAIGSAGGSQPHTNMQPYLALNYVIALVGVYPARS